MFSQLLSRIIILVLGNLYPAYASFKAVKSKNAREYARWMMYWIVFAIFTVGETFTDILLSWFPFYYELKIAFVVWLLLPTFKGSSFIYRKLLHPYLIKNEKEIDLYIEKSREIGSQALVTLGRQGFDAAQRTIAQKGPLWRSVSAQYLDQIVSNRDIDYDAEDVTDAAGPSGHGRNLNAGDTGAGRSDDVVNRRQGVTGVSGSGSTGGHRPVIKQQSAAPIHNQHLRQRSGSHAAVPKRLSTIPDEECDRMGDASICHEDELINEEDEDEINSSAGSAHTFLPSSKHSSAPSSNKTTSASYNYDSSTQKLTKVQTDRPISPSYSTKSLDRRKPGSSIAMTSSLASKFDTSHSQYIQSSDLVSPRREMASSGYSKSVVTQSGLGGREWRSKASAGTVGKDTMTHTSSSAASSGYMSSKFGLMKGKFESTSSVPLLHFRSASV